MLEWVKAHRINGIISDTIVDEALRHADKISRDKKSLKKEILDIFLHSIPAPQKALVSTYEKDVIDVGDAHVLASCYQSKVDYLVTLDKKHLLILKHVIKNFKIVTPKDLILLISQEE